MPLPRWTFLILLSGTLGSPTEAIAIHVVEAKSAHRVLGPIPGSEIATQGVCGWSATGEFSIRFMDGTIATESDYQPGSDRDSSEKDPKKHFIVWLEPKNPAFPKVAVEHLVRDGDHFIRKRLKVEGTKVVDEIAVESLVALNKKCVSTVGGFGQPVFIDEHWFAGLEFPAGTNQLFNGRLTCSYHPGKASFVTPWTVFGRRDGDRTVEEAFERYLNTIRPPVRASLQYNGWFDRREGAITPETMERVFRQFDERLLKPYGLHFDAFVIDDGYQNPDSLWECNQRWPEGFAPFAKSLEARGSRLGLWLPLNGYHLNTDWGAKKGWERSNHPKAYYCVAGAKYHAAILESLRLRIRDGNLAYMKHDFNFLHCSADGHGHLPTEKHGLAAATIAQMELLAFERSIQKDIWLNLTSNIWPSPWWLMTADSLWMGGGDQDWDWSFPQATQWEAEMTYRDQQFYDLLRVRRTQVPINSLMTHGIILGQYARPNGDLETPELQKAWADYVMMYFGRGTMLHELYISPDVLPKDYWETLGRAIRWARSNVETLKHSRMIGGRPGSGSVYGYEHWPQDKGIVVLRNPACIPAKYRVVVRNAGKPWHPIIVYPHGEALSPTMRSFEISLPSASVTVIEFHRTLPEGLGDLAGRFAIADRDGGKQLVRYVDPTPLGLQPPSAPRDENRKAFSTRLQFASDPSAATTEIRVSRQPADGMKVSAKAPTGSKPTIAEVAQENRARWNLSSWQFTGRPEAIDIEARLPFSTFWPERSRFSAVLRSTVKTETASERAIDPKFTLPDWPAIRSPELAIQEHVIATDVELYRFRSTIESLAWFGGLGLLPILVVCFASELLLRHHGWLLRFFALAAAILMTLLMIFPTPLGIALARAISGGNAD